MAQSNQRLGFAIIVAAAVIILLTGIRGLAGIITPILLASVITITLLPVPIALGNRGLKTGPALLLTILMVVVFIVGFSWFVLTSVSSVNTAVPAHSAQFEARNSSGGEEASALEATGQSVMSTMNSRQYSQVFSSLLSAIGNSVAQLFLTLLIFVFMLYTALSLPNGASLGINTESGAIAQVINLTGDVRRYMVLTAGINLLVGIGDAILLWIVGVPNAILWGVIAWILGFIPAIGYWIALIPPVLLAYSLYGTRTALVVFIGYALINGTAANIISPRVLGKGLSISPLVVFISVFIWGWLLGGIGAMLAIPLTMLIIAILRNFAETNWLARLMSYVPGSEKEPDTDAVDHAKGLWGKFRENLPLPKPYVPAAAADVDAETELQSDDTGELSN